jgi:hypothetical protein
MAIYIVPYLCSVTIYSVTKSVARQWVLFFKLQYGSISHYEN